MRKTILALGAACVGPVALAQSAEDALALIELLSAERLQCEFGPGTMAAWEDGSVAPMTVAWTGEAVVYDHISINDGTAARGDAGIDGPVRIVPTNRGMHFYEFGTEGDLSIATVTAVRDAQGRYLAVLSRHTTAASGVLAPAQYYGACASVEPGMTRGAAAPAAETERPAAGESSAASVRAGGCEPPPTPPSSSGSQVLAVPEAAADPEAQAGADD
jgi:hypothetical protein